MKKLFTILTLLILILGIMSCKNTKNPLLEEWDTPYSTPPFDRIHADDFKPAIMEAINMHNKEIEEIIKDKTEPTFENCIIRLDNSGEKLNEIALILSNLIEANYNDTLEQVAQEVFPLLSKHNDEILLNDKLFKKIKYLYDNINNLGLNDEQKRTLELYYRDFVRAGAQLNDADKQKLKDINQRLSVLTLNFGMNVQKDNNNNVLIISNKEELNGMPESLIATGEKIANERNMPGKWVYTTDKAVMIPFLQYCPNRELRKKLYDMYLMRGDNDNENDNKKLIKEILNLRLQKANLLGYKTYADYVLEDRMAKNPTNVFNLLDQIWSPSIAKAKVERDEMQKIINSESDTFKLQYYDWWYYAEKIRNKKYALDENNLKPYFSLNVVRDAVFTLSNKLYGITFKKLNDISVYNPEVEVYEVIDNDGSHLAILYLDYYTRNNKQGGAWTTSFRDQYRKDNKNITPLVSIVFNFPQPVGNDPSLLSMDDVETFFHEFGHALHGFFSDVTYKRLSGYVPRDFVELPSQILEHWAFEPQMLKLYAKHYKTGELIPDSLIEKIKNSKYFNQGFAKTEFLAAAYLDMDYHILTEINDLDVRTFEQKSMDKIGLIPEIKPRYRSTYFNHIFSGGYSAGYYCYLWSEVLDCDAYHAFLETGDIFNKDVANKFRQTILAPGGKKDAEQMYLDFRGKEPDIKYLLEDLGFIQK